MRDRIRVARITVARIRVVCLVLAVALAGCTEPPRSDPAPPPAPGAPGPGELVLFDGSPPSSWSQAGPGDFELLDGSLVSRGGLGMLWYSGRSFRDFALELDWRVSAETDNSGVFVRFPIPGSDPGVAIDHGYEIQINDNPDGDPQKTGAIYGFQPASARASRPAGEWNHYSIQAVGADYTVRLNDVVVNRFTGTDPGRGREGYIGLQNHDPASRVHFRNIRLRVLQP